MTWQQTLAEYAESQLTTYGLKYTRAMLPQLINYGTDLGMNKTQILADLRGAGFKIRTNAYWQVASEVTKAASMIPSWTAMDPSQVPSRGDFAEWSVTRGTGFMYRFMVMVRDQAGNVFEMPRGVKTYGPVAPGEIMQDVADFFSETPDEIIGPTPKPAFMGIRLTGLYQLQQRAVAA